MVNIARAALSLLYCTLGLWDNASYCTFGTKTTRTINFEVHISPGNVNPTGAGFRKAILVNGSFPGPTLRINVGDEVEFLVHNHLQEDTTVHFHGVTQRTTPWSDGTPGISQPEIRPGASYLYKWIAEESGVYFYHAHNRGQIMDGLYGSIIILPSDDEDRPFHRISRNPKDWAAMREAEKRVHPLLISDWSQYTFSEFYRVEQEANIDFTCMDAIVVNGAGSQYCLDRASLDAYTNPLVKPILNATGEEGITDKGCVPPIQLFQGNFTLHLDNVPPEAYRRCVGGVGGNGNYTVDVHSRYGWAALTFVNPGGLYPLLVTIDNHPLHIYAVDGQYIYPQTVDQVLVNNGNRISVFVKLDQQVGSYTIRIANSLLGQVLGGFAQLTYNGVNEEPPDPKPTMDYAGRPLIPQMRKFEENDGSPYPPLRPARHADRTRKFLVRKLGQPYGAYEWSLSGHQGYNMSEEAKATPYLFSSPRDLDTSELLLKTKKDEWVDLILEIEGPFAQAHPMHKHGNKAFVLGSGVGSFPWKDVDEAASVLPPGTFNWVDPPYRDSFNTIEGVGSNTWLVLRYKADHPGAWLFHCHIQTHLTGGMGIVILDGVDDFPKVPEEYVEWNGFPKPQFAKIADAGSGKLQAGLDL